MTTIAIMEFTNCGGVCDESQLNEYENEGYKAGKRAFIELTAHC